MMATAMVSQTIVLPAGVPGAMSIKDAAAWTGLGEALARRLVQTGEWPSIKIGIGVNGRRIIPTAALVQWLNDHVGDTLEA